MNSDNRKCPVSIIFLIFAVLLLTSNTALAKEGKKGYFSENSEHQSSYRDDKDIIKGYPVRKRYIGGPTDVEWDLDNSFPKKGSLLEIIMRKNCSQSLKLEP